MKNCSALLDWMLYHICLYAVDDIWHLNVCAHARSLARHNAVIRCICIMRYLLALQHVMPSDTEAVLSLCIPSRNNSHVNTLYLLSNRSFTKASTYGDSHSDFALNLVLTSTVVVAQCHHQGRCCNTNPMLKACWRDCTVLIL